MKRIALIAALAFASQAGWAQDKPKPAAQEPAKPAPEMKAPGKAARQALTDPNRLVSMVSFQAFGLLERNGPTGPWIPAAAISTSRPPNRSAGVMESRVGAHREPALAGRPSGTA